MQQGPSKHVMSAGKCIYDASLRRHVWRRPGQSATCKRSGLTNAKDKRCVRPDLPMRKQLLAFAQNLETVLW